MKIWKLSADVNNYTYFILPDDKDRAILIDHNFCNGTLMKDLWKPLKLELFDEPNKGDMAGGLLGIPIFNRHAIRILHDFLDGNVELLKLDYDREEYYAVNVLQVIDCIDYEKAIPVKFEDIIYEFEKYAFRNEVIQGKHIFNNIDEKKGEPFVSDAFRERVIQNNLKGFCFTEVWDSDIS